MSVRSSVSSRALQRFLFLFITIILSSTGSRAQSQSTNIEVSSAIQQSSVSRIGVTLSGVELEDAFQRQSKSRGLNPAVFREELVGALKELHPGTIRMEFPDLGQQPAGKFSVSSAAESGKSVSGSGYGLGEFLQLCAEAGSDPWLRIPSGTTPGEMRELVEYLTGTGSDPWSAARIGGGQSEPWTEVFGKIHVELGNESVTGVAASERMEAGVYADRANADYGAARQTAGFDGSKFDLMLSGAGVSAEWVAAVLGQSREQDSVAIAADLPWPGAGTSQAELYGALLAGPEAMDSTGGVVSREVARLARVSSVAARGTSVNVGRSQLSLAEGSEQLAQSWGAGLAQAEHLLQMIAMGVRYQNGSVLTENSLYCVDGSQAGNCRSSQFLTEALANGVIGGTMLQTVQTGANPSWSQVLSGEAVRAHALQSFAFAEAGKVSLVVFNLSRTAELPLTFSGRNAPAGDVQMTQIAPREITNSNESGAELRPSTQTLSASDVSGGLTLPPFSMTLLRWTSAGAAQTLSNSAPARTPHAALAGTPQAPPKLTKAVQVLAATPSDSSQTVFNCPDGFASTGACGVSLIGSGGEPFAIVGSNNGSTPGLSGTQVDLIPVGASHNAISLNYTTPVNVQDFTASYTFVPNGWNLAFVLQNNTNTAASGGLKAAFSAGAGCEAGFYQGFTTNNLSTNNIFALALSEQDSLTAGVWNFTYSGVQIFSAGQSPCNPDLGGSVAYVGQNKISTSPVPLTLSTGAANGCLLGNGCSTTTGHTYSATITYDGSTVTLKLCDVTAGGACFTHTWPNVDIPAMVGSNTAYLGLTAGSGNAAMQVPLLIGSSVYTAGNSGSSTAATPTFSVPAGTYATAQTVTISDTTSGATIYYTTDGTTPTTSSTKYTTPLVLNSSGTFTVQAIAVASGSSNSAVATVVYTIHPTLAKPIFSPVAGSYTTSQTVTISDVSTTTIYYTTDGSVPTTSSTPYSGPVTVASNETINAIAVLSGFTNSPVVTAAYTIQTPPTTGTVINYTGGFAASQGQVILNGNTQLNGTALQLTNGGSDQASAAWFVTPVNIQSFTTKFTFQLSNPAADGITFAIQNQDTAALGDMGGGLGYQHIPTSVAVKFDLYNNAGEGTNSTGLYTDGAAPTIPAIDLTPSGVNLHSGDTMAVQLTYDGTNLAMTITDTVTQATFSTSWAIDIPATVGGNTAYVGFTAGTGGLTSSQEILTWTYAPGTVAPVLPTPTFSVAAGIYTTAQTVTITTSTRDETIYYTTDGTTPTTSSTPYTAAIVVNGTEILKAIGAAPGFTNSPVATAAYTIATAAINFANGFSGSGGQMTLNGDAQLNGSGLLLTGPSSYEIGTAWYATPVNVQAFTTDFTFQLSNALADGFTFAIQNNNADAVGAVGGGLGYESIPNSIAVKFDLYSNGGEGTDSTGLYTAGAVPTTPATDMTSSGVNLHSGDTMAVHMVYNGTTLTMTITDTVTNASFSNSWTINIPATVGSNTAYVGFTGGTGWETASQKILTWTYTP